MTISDAEVRALRRSTPGCAAGTTHLNNAGAALMPTTVLDTVTNYMARESSVGGYEAQAEALQKIDHVYTSLGNLIGASSDEIAVFDSATSAWQRAFYSLPIRAGERILTSSAEFAANHIAFLQVARRTGATVEVVADDEHGALDLRALDRMIDESVAVVAVTWVPTNGGLINPAAQIGAITRAHGVPFLLDACQAVGQIPIDVADLGCDLLTATGRKFLRAPRGTGFLYVSGHTMNDLQPAFLDLFGAPWDIERGDYVLRSDARRFECWEASFANRLGLGAAAELALEVGVDRIEARSRALATSARKKLAALPGVTVRDKGSDLAAIVSFSHSTVPATAIKDALSRHRINVSVSPPSSTPVDAHRRHLPDLVRLSPHYYNTDEEVDKAIDIVTRVAM
ncbi:aminotransferase class V-fold PLP-dependent enzyme [Rhodococcus fascians]|nr:aminotransferase class V-fold PLP-dependent enzyme [Rhodococcus fascians]MBY4114540.1 aminotransferase class V-fold PLP-dependent enzyme [Rhodococcus fascians]